MYFQINCFTSGLVITRDTLPSFHWGLDDLGPPNRKCYSQKNHFGQKTTDFLRKLNSASHNNPWSELNWVPDLRKNDSNQFPKKSVLLLKCFSIVSNPKRVLNVRKRLLAFFYLNFLKTFDRHLTDCASWLITFLVTITCGLYYKTVISVTNYIPAMIVAQLEELLFQHLWSRVHLTSTHHWTIFSNGVL